MGNHQALNYKQIVIDMVKSFGDIGCLMSLKLHIMDSHLDYFANNPGHKSDEQGGRVHQDIKEMKRRYLGFRDERMLGDYCWNLNRHTSVTHKRKALTRPFEDTCRMKKPKLVRFFY